MEGSQIIDQCMRENLIDRFIITIIPTVLSEGIPLFVNPIKLIQLRQIGVTILNKCVECAYIRV